MGRLKVQCYKVMVASHFIVALVEKELGKEEMGLSILNLNLNRLSEAFHGGLVVAIRMLENSELEMNPRVLGVCSGAPSAATRRLYEGSNARAPAQQTTASSNI